MHEYVNTLIEQVFELGNSEKSWNVNFKHDLKIADEQSKINIIKQFLVAHTFRWQLLHMFNANYLQYLHPVTVPTLTGCNRTTPLHTNTLQFSDYPHNKFIKCILFIVPDVVGGECRRRGGHGRHGPATWWRRRRWNGCRKGGGGRPWTATATALDADRLCGRSAAKHRAARRRARPPLARRLEAAAS